MPGTSGVLLARCDQSLRRARGWWNVACCRHSDIHGAFEGDCAHIGQTQLVPRGSAAAARVTPSAARRARDSTPARAVSPRGARSCSWTSPCPCPSAWTLQRSAQHRGGPPSTEAPPPRPPLFALAHRRRHTPGAACKCVRPSDAQPSAPCLHDVRAPVRRDRPGGPPVPMRGQAPSPPAYDARLGDGSPAPGVAGAAASALLNDAYDTFFTPT